MSNYCLYIDESGTATPDYEPEWPYVLVGCAIPTKKKEALKAKADALKKKYFKKTNVVLHHSEIASEGKEFKIFRGNPELKAQFQEDLLEFLRAAPVVAFVALVDKKNITSTWKAETLIRKTIRAVYFNYIAFLYSSGEPKGQIIIEAATSDKDVHYLQELSYFLAPSCKEIDEDFQEHCDIKDVVTSITFVTKRNNDIETQIADIFGYAATCLFREERKEAVFTKKSYEHAMISVLKQKLFKLHPQTGPTKRKFFSKVQPFLYIPR